MMRVFFVLIISTSTLAFEPSISLEEAKKQGYQVFNYKKKNLKKGDKKLTQERLKKLAWPFEKPWTEGFMGNNFAQYQPYSPAGYHGGVDMILEKNSWVLAPVDGKLEAGHYSYTHHDDGHRTKHWKPWPARGNAASFELAVIDQSGVRFELHHVERSSLPAEIVDCLGSVTCEVKQGQRLGRVYTWATSFHYHHVHLNVYDEQGRWSNPEFYFEEIKDTQAPHAKVYVQESSGRTVDFFNGEALGKNAEAFIIAAYDKKDGNRFHQSPVYFSLKLESGQHVSWDFRKTHTNQSGSFSNFTQVYPRKVRLPSGRNVRQPGTYYPNNLTFYYRIPLPQNTQKESFILSIEDSAGNKTQFEGKTE